MLPKMEAHWKTNRGEQRDGVSGNFTQADTHFNANPSVSRESVLALHPQNSSCEQAHKRNRICLFRPAYRIIFG